MAKFTPRAVGANRMILMVSDDQPGDDNRVYPELSWSGADLPILYKHDWSDGVGTVHHVRDVLGGDGIRRTLAEVSMDADRYADLLRDGSLGVSWSNITREEASQGLTDNAPDLAPTETRVIPEAGKYPLTEISVLMAPANPRAGFVRDCEPGALARLPQHELMRLRSIRG